MQNPHFVSVIRKIYLLLSKMVWQALSAALQELQTVSRAVLGLLDSVILDLLSRLAGSSGTPWDNLSEQVLCLSIGLNTQNQGGSIFRLCL